MSYVHENYEQSQKTREKKQNNKSSSGYAL